jgi:hypothetical protein
MKPTGIPVVVLVLGAVFWAAPVEERRQILTDITAESGLAGFRNVQGGLEKPHILEVMGGGAAFLDFNRDGNLDVLLVRGSTIERYREGGDLVCALYRGNGKGRFQDVTREAGLTARGWGMGVAIADYNSDGWDDIFVTGYGRNFLFRNREGGTFEEVAEEAGVARTQWSLGAAFADIDGDGHLDLYVANYLNYPLDRLPKRDASCNYRGFPVFCGPRGLPGLRDNFYINDGKGRFRDIAEEAGIDPERLYGLGVVIADYDNDGLPDIFVANDLATNLLYRNLGNRRFEELAVPAGAALSEDGIEEGSMGVDFGDIDNDGWLDLYYTNSSYQSNTLLWNSRDTTFTNLTNFAGHGQSTWLFVGWGTAFADLDLDGREDLFVVNGHLYPEADKFEMGLKYHQRPLLFLNQGNRKFREAGLEFGILKEENGRGLAVGDFDNDGDLDLLINNLDGAPTLLRNDIAPGRHWLIVQCAGREGNRSAIGARLTLTTVDRKGKRHRQVREIKSGTSYLSHNDLRVHFGLGPAASAEELRVRWASGKVEVWRNLEANQILTIDEGKPF